MADKRAKLVLGLFMVSAIVVLALSFYTGFSLNSLMSSLEQSRNERLLAEAQAASLIVSADELDAIRSTKALSSEEGAALERRLSAFATLHNLTEVSFVRQLPSGELQYIVSSNPGTNSHDISSPPFASNDLFETALLGLVKITGLQGSELDASPFMAYSPVYNSSGEVIAVAAIAVDDQPLLQTNTNIRNLTIILLVCIAVVILAACANVLLQVRKEHELEDSVEVQRLMVRISQGLSTEHSFNDRVNEMLAALGGYLGTSLACVIAASESPADTKSHRHWCIGSNSHECNRESVSALIETVREMSESSQTEKPSVVCCPDVRHTQDKRYEPLGKAQCEAILWSPLYVQGELWGVLALGFPKAAQKGFMQKDIQLVESATASLIDAITRELYSEQRELALNHAVRASEAKSEFLSNMSHEMRTPMNAIIGMTSIALKSKDSTRRNYCLEHINSASKHLLSIINDMLDMASIQTDELSLNLAPFDFRQTLETVVSAHLHKITEQELEFSVSVDDRIPTYLVGDRQRLSKIVSNLLSNAIKFTPNKGQVTLCVEHLGVKQEGHQLMIEVKDSGIGMDPAVRENLFSSFEQVESGANRKYGGTGLGLAISRHLVELMGGQIDVESAVGKGSKFSFVITLEESSDATPTLPDQHK